MCLLEQHDSQSTASSCDPSPSQVSAILLRAKIHKLFFMPFCTVSNPSQARPSASKILLLHIISASLHHRSQPAGRQSNQSDLINDTDRVLVLWQVSCTSVGRNNGRRARVDRRERGRTNVKRRKVVVRDLDSISRVSGTLRQDRTGLQCQQTRRPRINSPE
jgi:hypothetical protein